MYTLPHEMQEEIVSRVDTIEDLMALELAMPSYKHHLRSLVTKLSTRYYTAVSFEYLESFRRLRHTHNIGLKIKYEHIDLLRRLFRLRSLILEVVTSMQIFTGGDVQKLLDALGVADKADDQYWRIYIPSARTYIFVKNNVVLVDGGLGRPQLHKDLVHITSNYGRVSLSPLLDMLDKVKGSLEPIVRDVAQVFTKYRCIPHWVSIPFLMLKCREALGDEEYQRLVSHYFYKLVHQCVISRMMPYTDSIFGNLDPLLWKLVDTPTPDVLVFYEIPKIEINALSREEYAITQEYKKYQDEELMVSDEEDSDDDD